jgi:SAM-dependent methyltransferase
MKHAFERTRSATSEPTPDDILRDLVDFHGERPGITERTLGEATLADGRTGYDLLAASVPTDARSVLELGAGNGPLLERLLARTPRLERVIGVDACAPELERARARCGEDPRLTLLAETGQAFDVPEDSLDAVLSHHAFYLMNPVEPVVERIVRALRPGGVFASITWSARSSVLEPFAELMRVFSPLTRRDNPSFRGWGDPRAFSLSGLAELLVVPGHFEDPLEWQEHDLVLLEPTAALVERLVGFFYSAHLQAPHTREELRSEWTRILETTTDAQGRARLEFPFALVRGTRKQPRPVNGSGGAS